MSEKNKTFLNKANTLLGLQFLSDLGDQITTTLLALCIFEITQSTGKIGFVYVFNVLGFVLFTLVGGILGDTLGRKNILCIADVARGLIILALIFAVKEKSIILIYATSFLVSMLGSVHAPAKISVWAETISSKLLERYNSLSELSIQSSMIAGPLIASFFVTNQWTNYGFLIDAFTFFMCAMVFSRIISDQSSAIQTREKREFLKGFKIIFQTTEIKKYIAYDAIQMIGFGAFNATFLVLAQRDFGWSQAQYSGHLFIVALWTTTGAVLGATQFATKINPTTKLATCTLISAFTLFAALLLRSFPLSSICVGTCDASVVLTMAVTRTKVQLMAKEFFPNYLSSVISSRSIIIKMATLLGVGICLVLAEIIMLETTLMLMIIPIALAFFSLIPTKRRIASTPIKPTEIEKSLLTDN